MSYVGSACTSSSAAGVVHRLPVICLLVFRLLPFELLVRGFGRAGASHPCFSGSASAYASMSA